MLKCIHVAILFSVFCFIAMFAPLFPKFYIVETITFDENLKSFESSRWYGSPRYSTTKHTPQFPAQLAIVKVCSMCKKPYWMAFPTNLTLNSYYFAGENGIKMETRMGVWDIAETRLANAILSFGCRSKRQPALMVDVGMNIGYFSGMALAAGCRVVSFEPTTYHHPYAIMTSILSGHQNRFMIYNLAASNKTGDKIPYNDWSISDAAKLQSNIHAVSYIHTTRIDDIIHEDILLLKVDVEGHEPQAIQGLSGLLKSKNVWVIVWENSASSSIQSADHPVNYLKKFGYLISDLHHGGTGNYVALHPQIDPILHDTIMAIKEVNIEDAVKNHGIDWWNN